MNKGKNSIIMYNQCPEVSNDQEIYHHTAQNGTLFIMANTSTLDLTFCKVTSPISQDDLHITIPPDPQNPDERR